MHMSILISALPLLLVSGSVSAFAQVTTDLGKVYKDESHCLIAPEIRGDKDRPISCYCRDALAIARYLYQNYMGKDRNLTDVQLVLEEHATEVCGEGFDVIQAAEGDGATDWKWTGPEVRRLYPSDGEIERIKPDADGYRSVQYEVRLTHRDPQGRVTKVESFKALDRLPPDFRKYGCPANAVCPK
ncbi:MAG: hypothetical protein ABSH47_12425 [Bryobacteraceae bacterium]